MTEIDLKRNTGLISLGVHTFKVVRTSEEEGPKGPYWRLICRVEDKSPDQGRECMLQLPLGESTRWKMDSFLDAVKAPVKGAVDHSYFMNKLFRATIVYDDSSGATRANPTKFMPYDGPTLTDQPGFGAPPPASGGGLPAEFTDEDEGEVPF